MHPDVCRLLKGVFEQRPALPKYSDVWDPDQVLQHLAESVATDLGNVSIKDLTKRTATLLALLTGQRGQALHALKVSDIRIAPDSSKCRIIFTDIHKTSKPGNHTAPADVLAFSDSKLCLVNHLKLYIERTKDRRKSDGSLFLACAKPYTAVSRGTFSRWVKAVLAEAGIDTCRYSSHSTRAAACSAVAERASLPTVLKAAGWKSDSVFGKFYKRALTAADQNFGQVLLDRYLEK